MTEATEISGHRTLVLGGTRSGKSAVAEALAAGTGSPVTYVATATLRSDDADHVARIVAHRLRRPAAWTTLECPDPSALAGLIDTTGGTLLVDSLGTWLAAHRDFEADTDALVRAVQGRAGSTILVSEEVGWSLHAPTPVGRQFVDALGTVNQRLADVCERALLVVAGRVLPLERFDPGAPRC